MTFKYFMEECFLPVVFLLGMLGLLWFCYLQFFGEREGVVKVEDCRTTVKLNGKPWLRPFTCNHRRSKSNKLLYGFCAAVDTNGSVCDTAYVYEKEPEVN